MGENMKDNFKINFPRILKEKGKKQADVSRDLHIPYTTVSNWYLGKKFPRPDKMQKLADYLNVSVEDLISQTDNNIQGSLISDRIKRAIEESGLSYQVLQEKSGIPKSAIQRCASGNTEKLPIDRIVDIARALNVSPTYLMGWDENKNEVNHNLSPSNIKDPLEAIKFLLENPNFAAFGGYDLEKMSDEDIVDLANQIADSIKFFGQKYK